ncbi:GSCFA domain-containing protein [Roseivirga sp.]|uniref:GSCFA domain-containing protein n=1 Tax=Roseivirga sp. TaxID=1964215 RepID=UPI003B8D3971
MFRTVIEDIKHPISLTHQDKIITLGSCFANEIGLKLADNKFNVSANPFGTVFNPLSLFELIEGSIRPLEGLSDAYLKRDGVYYNYKFHSSINHKSKAKLVSSIEAKFREVEKDLKQAKVLFLTFGTAWIHEIAKRKLLVANCHKMPKKEFEKRLIDVQEIISAFFAMKEHLEAINPELQIVLTVSPIRHTKETLALNSVSKSVLRLACHYLSDMAPDVYYFPSYEMMMDDLRDYRFYEKDMIHVNEQGVDYLWETFSNTYFSNSTKELLKEWQGLSRALAHTPFNLESWKHQQFLKNTLQKLQKIQRKLPVAKEIAYVKSQLTIND